LGKGLGLMFEWTSVWGVKYVFENIDEAKARLEHISERYGQMMQTWEEMDCDENDDLSALEEIMNTWCCEGAGLDWQIEQWEKELAA